MCTHFIFPVWSSCQFFYLWLGCEMPCVIYTHPIRKFKSCVFITNQGSLLFWPSESSTFAGEKREELVTNYPDKSELSVECSKYNANQDDLHTRWIVLGGTFFLCPLPPYTTEREYLVGQYCWIPALQHWSTHGCLPPSLQDLEGQ